MNKFNIFWATLAIIYSVCLMGFLCFVAYIYYDTAMTLHACALSLKNSHERLYASPYCNPEETQWIAIMDTAQEVT